MLVQTQIAKDLQVYDAQGRPVEGKRVPLVSGDAFTRLIKQQYNEPQFEGSRGVRQWIADNGVHLQDIYSAFGYTPDKLLRASVRQVTTNDNLRPFFGPTTEEGFRLGIQSVADKFEPIIGTTVDIDGLSTNWYEIQKTSESKDTSDNYTLRTVAQGAEIPVSTIIVGEKKIGLTKKGRGIAWTDEALAMPVSLIQMFLQVLGIRIGQSYYKMVADRLVYGYFDDNSDDATTVDAITASTTTGSPAHINAFNAKYQDLLAAKDALEEDQGFPCTDVMMHPETLLYFRTLLWSTTGFPVFENGDIGKSLGVEIHRNKQVPMLYVVFFNRQSSLVRYVFKPFGTEDDRLVSQQVNATYASMTDAVVTGMPEARVVLDLS